MSDSTVACVRDRVLPLLAQAGRETMRLPDPGKKRRRHLPELLAHIPELTVIVDTFEQRVQRPCDDDSLYSGKKKQPTFKRQITVDSNTGRIVAVCASVPGPTAARKLLQRLPDEMGIGGDLAYLKRSSLRHQSCSPCRKPRGKDRPPEDRLYHQAFSSFRIVVEQTPGQIRHFQSLNATDRNHRRHHQARVTAVAGLVNRLPRFCSA